MITLLYICKIHYTKNTSSNIHMYSTNCKTTNDFNTILKYFMFIIYALYRYFYTLSEDDQQKRG
jgi:hypothetical protein